MTSENININTETTITQTQIVMLLDSSGSMEQDRLEMLQTINTFIKDQKANPIDGNQCYFSLYNFSNEYKKILDRVPIEMVNTIEEKDYIIGGSTALYDAMGNIFETFQEEKLIFVIITDGEENSSFKYKQPKIKEFIDKYTKTYGWNIIYLAADPMLITQGNDIGIDNTYGTLNLVADFSRMSTTTPLPLSRAISNYRSGGSSTVNFTL